jgi:outer membrane protein OmpA-like peptidoglycan-associated protein
MELDNAVAREQSDTRQGDAISAAYAGRMVALVVAAGFTLSACSSVPDAVNPVEWYKGTADFFSGDDEDETAEQDKPDLPGDKEAEYPNLSSVPEKPAPSPEAEREQVAEGLIADNQNARYTDNPAATRQAPRRSLNPAPADDAAPVPSASPVPPVRSQAAIPAPPAPAPVANAPRLQPPLTPDAMQPAPQFSGQSFDVAAGQGTVVISSNSVSQGQPQAAAIPLPGGSGVAVPAGANPLEAYNPIGVSQSVHLATIQFANGSANLSDRDRQILSQVAQIAASRGGAVRVIGHASQRTSDMSPADHAEVNGRISAVRANAVAQAIISMGVPANRLYVGGASASQPRYLEVMPSGEAGNRRAEIYIDL